MKYAICNEIFQDWQLQQTLPYIKNLGYHAIEIAPFTIAPHVTDIPQKTRQHIRQLAHRHNLQIAAIHWILVQTKNLHLTHPHPDTRQRTAQYLCHLIQFAADIGAPNIIIGSPKQRSILPGATPQQAWDWAKQTLQPALDLAPKHQTTLCIEPLSPAETNFINTHHQALQLIQELQNPHLKIILDVKAMHTIHQPIPQIIQQTHPHIAHFHANDPNLKGPGFGKTDYRPILQTLKQINYTGYISIEVFNFDEGPETIAAKSIQYLQKTLQQT